MEYVPFDLEMYRGQMHGLLRGKEAKVFWDALEFAVNAHADQWRKSGEAYIMHPCSVAKILAEEMDIAHPEILAAALLHDTVEDVEEVTSAVIADKFGHYVENIVDGCTKVTRTSSDKQTFSKLVHRKLFSGAAAKPEVILVKLADRLHNLRTLSSMPSRKRQKISDETLDIYAPLATVLGLFDIKREMYDLALSYKFPKQSAKLLYRINKEKYKPEVVEIVDTLREVFQNAWFGNYEVSVRTKSLWAYYDIKNRILRKKIDNPIEIIVVVENIPSCYKGLGIVNRTFPPIPRTIRDFIANPKPTGYQGLHTRANVRGYNYLIKIRSKDMAHLAQKGLFVNWDPNKTNQHRFFSEIQEMFDVLGSEESVSYRDVIAASGKKEIYTYTPQGDLVCLPVQSTVLDFAFRVHTEVGHTCVSAIVGGKYQEVGQTLLDGDVVKIIRAEKHVQFEQNMVEICQTARARAELSKALKRRRRELAGEIGESILRQEMRRYGLSFDILEKKEMNIVYEKLSLRDINDLYASVGEGSLKMTRFIECLSLQCFDGKTPLAPPTGIFNKIDLVTLDPVFVKISRCCKSLPIEKGLCGLLSERGLSVHKKDCKQLEKIKFQREEILDVHWLLHETVVSKKQTLIIMAATRQRIMAITGVAIEEMKILNLLMLTAAPTNTPAWELTFEVPSLYVLRQVLRHFDKSGLLYEFVLER